MSTVQHISDTSFAAEIEQHEGVAVVDMWAPWCGPCRMVGPIVDELATEFAGKVKVTKMNVDENPATSMRFNVRSIPTLLFFRDGKVVDTIVGALPKTALAERFARVAG
jgi:thioredoxin 1